MSKDTVIKKQLIEKIKAEVLGIPKYGIEDPLMWDDFIKTYFTRAGEIDNEKYSSQLNKVLSSAAMSQTLIEIRKRLDALIEQAED